MIFHVEHSALHRLAASEIPLVLKQKRIREMESLAEGCGIIATGNSPGRLQVRFAAAAKLEGVIGYLEQAGIQAVDLQPADLMLLRHLGGAGSAAVIQNLIDVLSRPARTLEQAQVIDQIASEFQGVEVENILGQLERLATVATQYAAATRTPQEEAALEAEAVATFRKAGLEVPDPFAERTSSDLKYAHGEWTPDLECQFGDEPAPQDDRPAVDANGNPAEF